MNPFELILLSEMDQLSAIECFSSIFVLLPNELKFLASLMAESIKCAFQLYPNRMESLNHINDEFLMDENAMILFLCITFIPHHHPKHHHLNSNHCSIECKKNNEQTGIVLMPIFVCARRIQLTTLVYLPFPVRN